MELADPTMAMSELEVLEEIANDAARELLLAGIEDTPSHDGFAENDAGEVGEVCRRLVFESSDEDANDERLLPPPSDDDDSTEGIGSPDISDISSLSGFNEFEEDEEEAEYASTFTGLPLPNPDTRREYRFVQLRVFYVRRYQCVCCFFCGVLTRHFRKYTCVM